MRLVTLDSREVGGRPGISLPSGEILDLSASPSGLTASQWRPQSVVSVLAEGDEGSARVSRLLAEVTSVPEAQREEWRRTGRLLPAAGTRLMPPIRRPGLLLMVADRSGGPANCYVKNPNSATGPDATIPRTNGDDRQLFLLGMIGLVLGRPLFRATAAQATRALAALTLVADLGTRRLSGGLEHGGADARQFPGACVIGPALVTLDELPAADAWDMVVRVNGRAVGSGSPGPDAAAAAGILATLSSRYAFRPGDVVGLPAGVGEFELPGASRITLALGSTLELNFTTGD
ncbi:MAG: fumarylacetoacetate hydrolase family protein [Chromatiales bacterium]|nr:fumarylacetoacetate hydrolase family protein [Chromatiales bacterium]